VDLAFSLETGEADKGGANARVVSVAGVVVVYPGTGRDGCLLVLGLV